MEKYIVKVLNMFSTFVEVEADSEEQAREFAKESLRNNEEQIQHSYEGTLPIEEWPVVEKLELEKMIQDRVTEQENSEGNKL